MRTKHSGDLFGFAYKLGLLHEGEDGDFDWSKPIGKAEEDSIKLGVFVIA
jgi:hypothetical protein